MKCIIPALNVKVLGRAIHSLSKIGDELHIEPQKEGLSFRTVNSQRSAYATFILAPSFFSYYKYEGDMPTDSNPDTNDIKCKIAMKSCLSVFRSTTSLDKNVESCQLSLDSTNENLIFELGCRYGISKIHFLPMIECEALQAVYTKDNVPYQLKADAKVFAGAIHHFQLSQDEITLSVNSEKVTLSNFVENAPDPLKVMRTELCLDKDEFDIYSVTDETSVTFRLKELRALLSFGEGVGLPISVNFESTGKPVVFVIKANSFETNFVLATLSAPTDTQSNCSQTSAVANVNLNPTLKRKNSKVTKKTSSVLRPSTSTDTSTNRISLSDHTPSSAHASKRCHDSSNNNLFNFPKKPSKETSNSRKSSLDCSLSNLNFDPIEQPMETENLNVVIDEIIPCTPPPPLSKQTRYFFKRGFESTFDPRSMPGYTEILAEYSAGEEDSN